MEIDDLDFKGAVTCFSRHRKLAKKDLETLRLVTKHQGRLAPTVGGVLLFGKELQSNGYFAHPYHSWERGLNENTNGLIRQFLPKGKDLPEVTDEEIQQVMDKLNNRPRKYLGFKTPNQVFFGINPPVALTS